MRILSVLVFASLVFITPSAQNLYASESVLSKHQPLVQELYNNIPYYVEYLFHTPEFRSNLTPFERHRLQLLRDYFMVIRNLPELRFLEDRKAFFLEEGGEERIAKTTAEVGSSIDFNANLLLDASVKIDIPFVVQILLHEFGHKLNDQPHQADIDGLATKAALYFKAYSKPLKISRHAQLHTLSLPIQWFQWQQRERYIISHRFRPNSSVFLETAERGFQSLTANVQNQISNASGTFWAARETAQEAFTDSQIHVYGWDINSAGKVSAIAREQKRLQPNKGRIFSFDHEVYGKSVGAEHQLLLSVSKDEKHFDMQIEPANTVDLDGSVQTQLEKSAGVYTLVLPEHKASEPWLLRLTTEDGPVFISAEKNKEDLKPLMFRFKVSTNRPSGFIEIHSIAKADGKIQFLDKFYWLATGDSVLTSRMNEARVRFMQMQVNGKWKKLNPEKGLIRNSWGESDFRIQLEKYKKIRHVRFVWAMSRKHYQSHLLKTPVINNAFEQSYVESRGFHGAEHAVENETYEEVFTERDLRQDERTLTVPLAFYPRHIATSHTSHYMMNMNMFGSHTFPVTTKKILAEDLGYRQLLDILITDENMETTSLLKSGESLSFMFNNSGLSECEEYLLRQKQYYDFSEIKVKGRRR